MRKEQKKQVRLGSIIEDMQYQTRRTMTRVREYADCMKMGHKFPPLVIDKKTNKIICGFTRYNAYKSVYKDPDFMIDAVFIDFKDDRERLGYSANDNAHHGQPLDAVERRELTKRLNSVGWDVPDICSILGMKTKDVRSLIRFEGVIVTRVSKGPDDKVVTKMGKDKKLYVGVPIKVKETNTEDKDYPHPFVYVDGEETVLVKKGLSHLNGKNITKEAYNFIDESYLSWSDVALVNHLVNRIDYNLLNVENEAVIEALGVLKSKLNELF